MTDPFDEEPRSTGDRVLAWLDRPGLMKAMGLLTVGIVLGTLVLVVLYGPDILNSTSAVKDGTELTGCRSSYSAEVTDRRTEFDIARSHRDSAASEVNLVLLELAQAAIFGDDSKVAELQGQLPGLRQEVRIANVAVAEADAALIEANDIYQDAVALSRDDPAQFLADCSNGRR